MSSLPRASKRIAVRGEIVYFVGDPMQIGERAFVHLDDGVLLIDNGVVVEAGLASRLLPGIADDIQIVDRRGKLIVPGFVDTHVHFPQVDVIASHGEQLLDWLERFTFPVERGFDNEERAAETAAFFLDELLKNGTTSAGVYATVHPQSVEAFFEAARSRRMRMAAGKVLMDRNCPEYLQDTAQSGYDDSAALIRRWHGVDRLIYVVTPRFAPTSTCSRYLSLSMPTRRSSRACGSTCSSSRRRRWQRRPQRRLRLRGRQARPHLALPPGPTPRSRRPSCHGMARQAGAPAPYLGF